MSIPNAFGIVQSHLKFCTQYFFFRQFIFIQLWFVISMEKFLSEFETKVQIIANILIKRKTLRQDSFQYWTLYNQWLMIANWDREMGIVRPACHLTVVLPPIIAWIW